MKYSYEKTAEHLRKNGYQNEIIADFQDDNAEFIQVLKALFTTCFEAPYVEANFELPVDFQDFISKNKGGWIIKGWASLYDRKTIIARTKRAMELYKPNSSNDLMWLSIGHWSDRHQLLTCCNKTSEDFGKVVDAWDDHPWLSDDFLSDEEYDSILLYAMDPE